VFSLVDAAVNMHDTSRICCRAPCCSAVAAGRPLLSIDVSCLHGAQQQTRRTLLLRWNDGTDGWTVGRTDAKPFLEPVV